MIASFIRWKDACAQEAAEPHTPIEDSPLVVLNEIGWLIGETDEAVSIGMEVEGDSEAGRWRLHIPKRNIIQRIDFEVPRSLPRARAIKGPKQSNRRSHDHVKAHQLVGDGRDVNAVPDRLRGGSAGQGVRDDAHSDSAGAERNG